MKKSKYIVLILILAVLILPGCAKTPKAFYKKVCKRYIALQEKIGDLYGSSYADFFDDADECVEKMVESEEDGYRACLEVVADEDCLDELDKNDKVRKLEKCVDDKDDLEDCREQIDEAREMIAEIVTKDGCEDMYSVQCASLKPTSELEKYASLGEINQMEKEYNDCLDDIEELCEDLPDKF